MITYKDREFNVGDLIYVSYTEDGLPIERLCRIFDTCGETYNAPKWWTIMAKDISTSECFCVEMRCVYWQNKTLI